MQGQRRAGTHHVVGLRLSNEDQYVGADDGQAEVEQDDGSFRADVSVEQTQKTAESLIDVRRGQTQRGCGVCPQECNYLHSTA